MHIILVSNRLARARSLTLTTAHLLGLGLLFALLVLGSAAALLWLGARHAAELRIAGLDALVLAAQRQQAAKDQEFLRDNLNAMAVKIGQMQAQLMRLDALGERLSALAGFKPQEFRFDELPGRGGAVSSLPSRSFTLEELNEQLERLSRQLDNRSDYLEVLESQLFDARVKKKLMPTVAPVDGAWSASSFGWRIDPFTGMRAMHEGVDFVVDVGTPVFAAAGGVVTYARFHYQYGNMVEIDHGNEFTTRYAHLSKLLVKEGDVVRRGQKIALSGSTGRATGPHLHFEVRYRGVAQNPARFLRAAVR